MKTMLVAQLATQIKNLHQVDYAPIQTVPKDINFAILFKKNNCTFSRPLEKPLVVFQTRTKVKLLKAC